MTLSLSEEAALIRRYQAGDRRAGDALLRAHAGFITLSARRYMREDRDNESIHQEARIGFLVAVSRFDETRDVKLITYARGWMRGYLTNWIENYESPIRIPSWQHHPTAPSKRDNAARSSLTEDAAMVLRPRAFRSMEATLRAGSEQSLGETLADTLDNPEDAVMGKSRKGRQSDLVSLALWAAKPRHRPIMIALMLSGEDLCMKKIGARFGITRERVRQIRNEALATMRKALGVRAGVAFEQWVDEAPIGRVRRMA